MWVVRKELLRERRMGDEGFLFGLDRLLLDVRRGGAVGERKYGDEKLAESGSGHAFVRIHKIQEM